MEEGTWGDSIVLKALSFAWGCRITILNALLFMEDRVRHVMTMKGVDFVLVYNGFDHYNGAGQ